MVPRDEVLEILFRILPRLVRALLRFVLRKYLPPIDSRSAVTFRRLIKEQDLPADRPYVFGYHPHGEYVVYIQTPR